ncbi:MAG: peptidoglycan editing factor PgeF [Caloramator sp.]|nr:peptidoglycan editing factor PgeF [Caloramator sp.]
MGYPIIKNKEGLEFLCSSKIEKINKVRHFFSTRINSDDEFNNFSLNAFNEDKKEKIKINYEKILKSAEMNEKCFVYLKQIHGNNFYVVDDKNYKDIIGKEGDALITSSKNIAVGVLTADCVPVLLCDYENNVIAAVHAGWRGTYQNITSIVIDYMIKEMGCCEKTIIAAIGPSIGPCCFEVSFDTAQKFTFVHEKNKKYYVDLWQENINQILKYGIPKSNIDMFKLCTYCNRDMFFSYRRDNGTNGRIGAFIQLV